MIKYRIWEKTGDSSHIAIYPVSMLQDAPSERQNPTVQKLFHRVIAFI